MNAPVHALAGRGRRLVATAIDAALVPSLTLILIMLTDVVEDAEDYQDRMWMLHVLGLAILSYLLLNGYWLWQRGQTVGKRLLGIRIAQASTQGPAPFWRLILIRAWFFPLMFLIVVPIAMPLVMLDLLLIFRTDRRCLHDLATGTEVIRARSD